MRPYLITTMRSTRGIPALPSVYLRRNLRALTLFVALIAGALPATSSAVTTGLRFYPMQLNYSALDNKGGVVMNVTNNTDRNYLLKGSVAVMDSDTGRFGPDDAKLPLFVILPPLARLEAGGKYSFRVRQVGDGLPADRESACIVSVTAIPATSEPTVPLRRAPDGDTAASADQGKPSTGVTKADKGSQLQIALRMNMRLFYRPEGIPERDNAAVAEQLRFRVQGDVLVVDNPTPYFVHLSEVSLNGTKVKPEVMQGYVLPKDSRRFVPNVPVKGPVEWHFGDDKVPYRSAITG